MRHKMDNIMLLLMCILSICLMYYVSKTSKNKYIVMDSKLFQNVVVNINITQSSIVNDTSMVKIFAIGQPKTGTSSLGLAFEILGYKWTGWNAALFNEMNITNIISASKYYDAFEDGPWQSIDFKIWYNEYPNALFILLDRDDKSWIHSMETWFSPKYNPYHNAKKYLSYNWIYNRDAQIRALLAQKHNQYKSIISFFNQNNQSHRLLIMNIIAGDGWNKLCHFLNKSVPSVTFPHTNRGIRNNKYNPLNDWYIDWQPFASFKKNGVDNYLQNNKYNLNISHIICTEEKYNIKSSQYYCNFQYYSTRLNMKISKVNFLQIDDIQFQSSKRNTTFTYSVNISYHTYRNFTSQYILCAYNDGTTFISHAHNKKTGKSNYGVFGCDVPLHLVSSITSSNNYTNVTVSIIVPLLFDDRMLSLIEAIPVCNN